MSSDAWAPPTDCAHTDARASQSPVHAELRESFQHGFEEDDDLRSEYVRRLVRRALRSGEPETACLRSSDCRRHASAGSPIPRTLVRFWHDARGVPADVQACLDSWEPLREEGVALRFFDDNTAMAYIASRYGPAQVAAFTRCEHPAMRSDYLRLCYILADGGLYVDADDRLVDDGWRRVFRNGALKLQPLCYDTQSHAMVPTTQSAIYERPEPRRIFYVNNNPIAAPPGHPVLRRALARATHLLARQARVSEIQSTTGPGNLTAALAGHVHETENSAAAGTLDLCLLFDWESTAKPDWSLGYRSDDRNWRNWRGPGTGPRDDH